MGMLLFTAFKLVEREIKKPQAGAEAAVGVGGGGGEEEQEVGLLLFPLVGRLPLSSICSFLPNRLFVGWLSYVLCVPLCKILYHTASRLSFAMAPALAPARADQTKPNRTVPGPCPALCAVFALPLAPPFKTDEATKWSCRPLSLLSVPPCAIVRSKHCFQCRLEAAPVDAAHRSPAPPPPSCRRRRRRRPTTGRHCCCCKFNRFGTRCVVV